jgi:hypothetical protein
MAREGNQKNQTMASSFDEARTDPAGGPEENHVKNSSRA